MITVTEFTSMSQIEDVLGDIRFLDLEEWSAGTGYLFGLAVNSSLEVKKPKDVSLMASDEVGPLCCWGCTNGRLWLFATNRASKNSLRLHLILRKYLKELQDVWPVLTATSYTKNKKHHEWLTWLGFEEVGVVPQGPSGLPFTVFVKETEPCA